MYTSIRIRQVERRGAEIRDLIPQIERIFFATAARAFPEGVERTAFREKWLGRFLDCNRDVLLVAQDADESVAGYLVGTFDNAAESDRFLDMPHFRTHFAAECAQYPAHLHINLDAAYRGAGLGSRMLDKFADCVRDAGLPGVHITTGRGMRNVGFYLRNKFKEVASLERGSGAMLFLGRNV